MIERSISRGMATNKQPVLCALGLGTVLAALFFYTVPLMVARARKDHLGDGYEEIGDRESLEFNNFRTFRDIPWEIFPGAHQAMQTSPILYYSMATPVFLINFVLWYLWFVFRVFVDFKLTLLLMVNLLWVAELIINSMTQFPPPPGFVQLEPEFVSFFLGMVTQGGFGMLSTRAALSFVMMYDWSSSLWPDRHFLRRIMAGSYTLCVCLFMLCTHQMYSISLVLNVLTAFSIFHFSHTLCGNAEKNLQARMSGTVRSEGREMGEARFSVDSEEEEEFVNREAEAEVETKLKGVGAEARVSQPGLSPSSSARLFNIDDAVDVATSDV